VIADDKGQVDADALGEEMTLDLVPAPWPVEDLHLVAFDHVVFSRHIQEVAAIGLDVQGPHEPLVVLCIDAHHSLCREIGAGTDHSASHGVRLQVKAALDMDDPQRGGGAVTGGGRQPVAGHDVRRQPNDVVFATRFGGGAGLVLPAALAVIDGDRDVRAGSGITLGVIRAVESAQMDVPSLLGENVSYIVQVRLSVEHADGIAGLYVVRRKVDRLGAHPCSIESDGVGSPGKAPGSSVAVQRLRRQPGNGDRAGHGVGGGVHDALDGAQPDRVVVAVVRTAGHPVVGDEVRLQGEPLILRGGIAVVPGAVGTGALDSGGGHGRGLDQAAAIVDRDPEGVADGIVAAHPVVIVVDHHQRRRQPSVGAVLHGLSGCPLGRNAKRWGGLCGGSPGGQEYQTEGQAGENAC
jgi:hypothetical protein